MSAAKKSADDKKIVVSFTSDSEDEANTSSSSASSSSSDAAMSSDEDGGTVKKPSLSSQRGVTKVTPTKTLDEAVVNNITHDQVDGHKEQEERSIKTETSPKVSTISPQKEVENTVIESPKKVVTLKDDDDDLPDLSRPKPAVVAELPSPSPVQQPSKDLEEFNLAPAKTSKSRSKSPQEPIAVAAVNDVDHKAAAGEILSKRIESIPLSTVSTADNDECNLSPVKTSKSRSKSPKSPAAQNEEEIISNESIKTEAPLKEVETIQQLELDSGEKQATKPSKKKKKSDLDEDQVIDSKNTLDVIDLSNETIRIVVTPPKATKKKSTREGESTEVPPSLTDDVELPAYDDVPIESNKVTSNGDDAGSTTPVTKKKSRKSIDEPVRPSEVIDSSTLPQKESTLEVKLNEDDAISTVVSEKSKRKKSSKSATPTLESESGEQGVDEGTPIKVLSEIKESIPNVEATIIVKEDIELPDISQNISEKKKSKKGKSIEDVTELTPVRSVEEVSTPLVSKVLEQAIQAKKVDAVVVNEVEDIPSSDITVIQAVSDAVPSGNRGTEDLPNDKDYKTSDLLPEAAPTYESDSRLTDESTTGIENQDSDFTHRRQSMDDFIKKILAEAREEQKKLKVGPTESTDSQRPTDLDSATSTEPVTTGEPKERSMLDRRLETVGKKRQPLVTGDDNLDAILNGGRAAREAGSGGTRVADDDADDSEISRLLNSRRQQRKANLDDLSPGDIDDLDSTPSEAGSTRQSYRNRIRSKGGDDYQDDLLTPGAAAGSGKPPLRGTRQRLSHESDLGTGESFVAKYRRERESSLLSEDSFAPKRSDETEAVIREKTRNIRTIIDQQTEVARSLRSTARSMEELDNEIRDVRQLSLDWHARIESLESAVDAEYRAYEADQQAASERMSQQRMPDDRALRDEINSQQAGRRRPNDRIRGESAEDEGFPPSRRRSGSQASSASHASSFMARPGGGGGNDSGNELSDLYPALFAGSSGGRVSALSRRSVDPRTETDLDYPSTDRLRRGGSLARDKYAIDMNTMLGFGGGGGGSGGDDDYSSPRSRASSVRPVIDMSSAQSSSDDVSRIRAKYAGVLGGGGHTPDSNGYTPPSRSSTSFGGSSYGLSPNSYSSTDASRGASSLRRDPLSLTSSRYGADSSASSLSLSPNLYTSSSSYTRDSHSPVNVGRTGGYGVSSLAALDASRMRRAQSVTDMYDHRPTSSLGYRGATDHSTSGGDFQSKFLDKVRGSGPALGASATPVSSYKAKGDKPFKSRFLKSTFDAGSRSAGAAVGVKSAVSNGYGSAESTSSHTPEK